MALGRFVPFQLYSYRTDVCNRKCFTIPELMFDPTLMLSPHVFLLAILFRRQAFDSKLNEGPHLISTFNIHPGDNELLLGLKPEVMDEPIFRRVKKTISGYQLSQQRITESAMAQTTRTVGRPAGFEYSTIAYSLRYMAGNKMDKSGTSFPSPFAF